MTDLDKNLIEIANKLDCTKWGQIEELIIQAQTPQARQELKDIETRLYHKEECASDLL